MTGRNADIERIVAEVMRRLEVAERPAPDLAIGTAVAAAPVCELPITDHVVTLATIADRLAGIRRVIVTRRAVVTPAVKDELRKRRIALDITDELDSPPESDLGVSILCCANSDECARRATTLAKEVIVPARFVKQLCEAVRAIREIVVDPRKVAILLTDQLLAAACLANRSSTIRAAAASDTATARQAVETIGANVLVMDPRGIATDQWRQSYDVFAQNLPRNCPPQLMKPQ